MVIGGLAGLAAGGLLLPGQDLFSDFQYPVPHAECVFFGPNHNSLVATGYTGRGLSNILSKQSGPDRPSHAPGPRVHPARRQRQ